MPPKKAKIQKPNVKVEEDENDEVDVVIEKKKNPKKKVEKKKVEVQSEDIESEEEIEEEDKVVKYRLEITKEPNIYLLMGVCRSGKSVLLRRLIYDFMSGDKPFYGFGLVICPTYFNGGFKFMKNQDLVWKEFNLDRFKEYVQKMRDFCDEHGSDKMPQNFIIWDDCLGAVNWQDGWMQNFISTYRHTNTSLYITAQQLVNNGSSTLLRENISYGFAFGTSRLTSIKQIYDCLGGQFEKEKEFRVAFKEATKDPYHCLAFVNGKKCIEDSYFVHCCDPAPEFSINFEKKKKKREDDDKKSK